MMSTGDVQRPPPVLEVCFSGGSSPGSSFEMDDQMYKELKQTFVSNLNGTSTGEISLGVTIVSLSVLLRDLLFLWLLNGVAAGIFAKGMKLALDFTVLVVPLLLSFTILADFVPMVLTVLLCTSIGILIVFDQQKNLKKKPGTQLTWKSFLEKSIPSRRPFITNFRAYVNISTAIAILAVDFVVFPRRFAKTETFGSGLMDMGVGSFMFSNAIVSPEARGKSTHLRSFRDRLMSVVKAVKSSGPLLVIGFIRLLSVKSTGYQEHVSEYGVHWNFFFTLATVKILSTVLLCIFPVTRSGILSLTVGLSYQYFITGLGMERKILHGNLEDDSREDFFDANREGIFSCFGYLSIYFAGIQVGQFLLSKRETVKDWLYLLITLWVIDLFFWGLLDHFEDSIQPISRRLANSTFVIWMVALNIQILASLLLVDLLVALSKAAEVIRTPYPAEQQEKNEEKCCLLAAVNRNGLFFFLLANLLTGLVNFSMRTIFATPMQGLGIVTTYMWALSGIAAALHTANISLRCW